MLSFYCNISGMDQGMEIRNDITLCIYLLNETLSFLFYQKNWI